MIDCAQYWADQSGTADGTLLMRLAEMNRYGSTYDAARDELLMEDAAFRLFVRTVSAGGEPAGRVLYQWSKDSDYQRCVMSGGADARFSATQPQNGECTVTLTGGDGASESATVEAGNPEATLPPQ